MPSLDVEAFLALAAASSGAAGYDGWSSHEAAHMCTHMRWLVMQLFEILKSVIEHPEQEDTTALTLWRVCGIPKRATEELRPGGGACGSAPSTESYCKRWDLALRDNGAGEPAHPPPSQPWTGPRRRGELERRST